MWRHCRIHMRTETNRQAEVEAEYLVGKASEGSDESVGECHFIFIFILTLFSDFSWGGPPFGHEKGKACNELAK